MSAGRALVAAALLLPGVAAVPAGAACLPRAQGSAELLQVRLPGQVPLQPLSVSRAGADQQSLGTDEAHGAVNRTSAPVPGVSVTLASGTADAAAAVTDTGSRSAGSSTVQRVVLDVAATPVTPALLVVVDGLSSNARVDAGGAVAEVTATVAVNGSTMVSGAPLPPAVVVPGVGVLHVGERTTSSDASGTSATATGVRLELETGVSVVVARSTARTGACP